MKHIKNTHQTHFRVMKKIYPKEWLELHPYKQTNSVDQYYVGIANEIHKRLYSSTIADAFEEEKNIRYTSLCLAAWFEDVISQTGIWQAFTAECRKRYGSYLPFYPIKGDYFPDEINLEDIRFLLWHHIQYLCRGISAINPENPGIEQTAQKIYGLLAEEYETAPENERMQEFLYHSAMKKKTSSATGRYWIGFTTNATSTSKMSPNTGTKLNGCWMMKRLLPKWQRPSYMPHAPH